MALAVVTTAVFQVGNYALSLPQGRGDGDPIVYDQYIFAIEIFSYCDFLHGNFQAFSDQEANYMFPVHVRIPTFAVGMPSFLR